MIGINKIRKELMDTHKRLGLQPEDMLTLRLSSSNRDDSSVDTFKLWLMLEGDFEFIHESIKQKFESITKGGKAK